MSNDGRSRIHGLTTAGYSDRSEMRDELGFRPPLSPDERRRAGIPEYVDPHYEKTEKIVVGTFAPGFDKCKCGATVHVDPDEISDEPVQILYDPKTFRIVGCPCCMVGL